MRANAPSVASAEARPRRIGVLAPGRWGSLADDRFRRCRAAAPGRLLAVGSSRTSCSRPAPIVVASVCPLSLTCWICQGLNERLLIEAKLPSDRKSASGRNGSSPGLEPFAPNGC